MGKVQAEEFVLWVRGSVVEVWGAADAEDAFGEDDEELLGEDLGIEEGAELDDDWGLEEEDESAV